MSKINRVFGNLLAKSRKQAGWTQDTLAEELGVSRVSVANYESGRQGAPLEQVVKASQLLGFSLDELKIEASRESFDAAILNLPLDDQNRINEAFDGLGDDDGREKKD